MTGWLRLAGLLFIALLASGFVAMGTYLVAGSAYAGSALAVFLATSTIGGAAILFSEIVHRPIDAAAALMRRYSSGEAQLRLNRTRGTRRFRELAASLNDIIDHIEDRELQFAAVSEATGDVIWEWRTDTESVVWTGELRKLFGVPSDRFEAGAAWWHGRVHPHDRARVERRLDSVLESNERHWSEEYRFRHEDGSYRWFWDRGVVMRDKAGKPIRFIGCMTDISAQRVAEERIWQLANQDELTGLPNRKVFHGELKTMEESSAADLHAAILLIDIDHFKDANRPQAYDFIQ